MILLSHPTADTIARHVAAALSRAGVLAEFWTCAISGNVARPCTVAPATCSLAPSLPGSRITLETLCRSLDHSVSSRLACEQFKGVYAYEDGASESFRIAGLRGMLRIYDLAAGHWQAEHDICAEEAVREPAWAATLPSLRCTAASVARRTVELRQADLVIVSSTFALSTLERVPDLAGAIALLPPGAPTLRDPSLPLPAAKARAGKLRALFVGELTQRNGLSYLFRACRELHSQVDLTVIGAAPAAGCRALERELQAVRWRASCSADELHAEFAAHDVLLAPALCNAHASVLLDAMAAGLPIIATPHTAGPDLVDDGIEGFIVPIRSADHIAAKLELLAREPDRRAEMSASARRRAQTQSWETYERAHVACVAAALSRR